jgi:hypothetical protein
MPLPQPLPRSGRGKTDFIMKLKFQLGSELTYVLVNPFTILK